MSESTLIEELPALIEDLPDEIWAMILGFVSENDMYFIVSTCRRVCEVYDEYIKKKLSTKFSSCFTSVSRVIWARDVMTKSECKRIFCRRFEMSSHWYRYAAKQGNVDVLKWLDEQGCEADPGAFDTALNHGHVEASWHLRPARISMFTSSRWQNVGKTGNYELYSKYKDFSCTYDGMTCLAKGIINNGHVKLMRRLIAEKVIEVNLFLIQELLSKSSIKMVEILDELWENVSSYIKKTGINVVMDTATTEVVDWLVGKDPLFANFILISHSSTGEIHKTSKLSHDTFKAYLETDAFLGTYSKGNLVSYFFKRKWTDLIDTCLEKNPRLISVMENLMYDCYFMELDLEFVKWCLGKGPNHVKGGSKVFHVSKDKITRTVISRDHDDIFAWLLSENLFDTKKYIEHHRESHAGRCYRGSYRGNGEFSSHIRLFVKYGVEIDWDILVKETLNVNGKNTTFRDVLEITNEVIILIKLLIENNGDKYLPELQKRLSPKFYDNAFQILLIHFPGYRLYL